MNETWKNTFDQIHAEPELKEHIKEYLSEKVYRVHDRRVSHFRRLAAASVLCLFLCAAGVCYLFFTPVTYISVDINPSLELSLNCFDRVVSVDGYNDDGKALAESLSLRYMNYMNALNRILESDTIKTLLSENNDLSLTVAGESETQSQKVLRDVEASVSASSNIHCHSGDMGEVQEAHSCGMSFGKYQAFQILQELDPSVTADEITGLTMHEIWERIRQLSDEDSGNASGSDSNSAGNHADCAGQDPSGSGNSGAGSACDDNFNPGISDTSGSGNGNSDSGNSGTGGSGNGNSDSGNSGTGGSGYGNSGSGTDHQGFGHHHGGEHE